MDLKLEDVLNLTPHELVDKLRVPEPEVDPKTKIKQLKQKLAGYFKDDPSLILTGHIFKMDNDYIMISSVVRSTGRIFFALVGSEISFSVPKSFLLGEEPAELPYKLNQVVNYDNEQWTVTSVNPASRSVRLQKHDKVLSINIDKLYFANKEQ